MISARYRFHGHGSLKYLFSHGQSQRTRHFVMRSVLNTRRSSPRIAVIVSKKVLKSAVGRNRIRRRVYNYTRQLLPKITTATDIAIIVTSAEVRSMSDAALREQIDALFQQLGSFDTSI